MSRSSPKNLTAAKRFRGSSTALVLGFDVGGTKFSVSLGNVSGKIFTSLRQPAQVARGPQDALIRLKAMGHELLSRTNILPQQIHAIGIAAPGPIDQETGELFSQPNAPGWDRVPLQRTIAEEFRRPTFLENDANACAVAEWMFGAGRELGGKSRCHTLAYLTFSTGIGAGLIINGQLHRGASGDAGEVGHHVLDPEGPLCGCGHRGCFEAFCGGCGIARQMREVVAKRRTSLLLRLAKGQPENLCIEILLEAAKRSDPLALEIFDRVGFRAAQGIGNLINILNPDVVALGTIPLHCGKYFFEPLRKYLPRFAWPRPLKAVCIVPCALGKRIGNLSAICAALVHL